MFVSIGSKPIIYLFTYSFTLLSNICLISTCNISQKKATVAHTQKTTAIRLDAVLMDKDIIKIVNEWCKKEGYLEADTSEYYSAYTAENTKIVVLDGNSYEDCFVFTSSIMCNQSGLFSGSCGYNIAVFKKNENAYA
jgi:hypothetical protein